MLDGFCAGLAQVGGAVGVAVYKDLKSRSTTVAMLQCALIAVMFIGRAQNMSVTPLRVKYVSCGSISEHLFEGQGEGKGGNR